MHLSLPALQEMLEDASVEVAELRSTVEACQREAAQLREELAASQAAVKQAQQAAADATAAAEWEQQARQQAETELASRVQQAEELQQKQSAAAAAVAAAVEAAERQDALLGEVQEQLVQRAAEAERVHGQLLAAEQEKQGAAQQLAALEEVRCCHAGGCW
jgi:chromosome segregation ATPase